MEDPKYYKMLSQCTTQPWQPASLADSDKKIKTYSFCTFSLFSNLKMYLRGRFHVGPQNILHYSNLPCQRECPQVLQPLRPPVQ